MELQELRRDLERLRERALADFAAAPDLAALDALDVAYLGKKGELTVVLRGIGALPPEDRPQVGAVVNAVRSAIEAALVERRAILGTAALSVLQEALVALVGGDAPLHSWHGVRSAPRGTGASGGLARHARGPRSTTPRSAACDGTT